MRGEVIPPQSGREEPTPGRFVVALLLFVLLAATCLLLLLAALVFWLAALTGSMAAAALIVGGGCLLLAAVVWLAALREPLARIGGAARNRLRSGPHGPRRLPLDHREGPAATGPLQPPAADAGAAPRGTGP